jgi:hypothetical protein
VRVFGWVTLGLASGLWTEACGAKPGGVTRHASQLEAKQDAAPVLQVAGAKLRLVWEGEAQRTNAAPVLTGWIERCAHAVASYYGHFPVPEATIRLRTFTGVGVHNGHASPTVPPTISIAVGDASSELDLSRDWTLTHEMVHLAFPSVGPSHHWIEEGLASYVEPIARARSGWISEDAVWGEWLDNMHQGLPEPGDRGLDFTPTWARTYWGGALFCLLADVEIRKQSENRYELGDALRAIVKAGGVMTERWELIQALCVGDEATHLHVLQDLYERMRAQPVAVDLADLWQQLGVSRVAEGVAYRDTAPLAAVRRAFLSAPAR